MLFNSIEFLLFYLPIVVIVYYYLINRFNSSAHIYFLVISSLIFYGWWNPNHIFLIIISVLVNYYLSKKIIHFKRVYFYKKLFLIFGIIFNLGLLAYFKYMNFFIENLSYILDKDFSVFLIILPLGISFYTFQQIAFLVDTFKQKTNGTKLHNYFLFVSFFPQLISGPIVHHKEMMFQFIRLKEKSKHLWENLSLGFTVITIGLFKKVVIAEKMANWSDQIFSYSASGGVLTFLEAWIGVLCFSFQIYFDFSAYSDIAIGLALLFGIKLPINFYSPYKATSIIEFWRLWHITLSRFLKNYLYIPLGGNKHGNIRRYLNLFLVMLLGGLWHGAGWTFILWGFLHGLFLTLNHMFRTLIKLLNLKILIHNIFYLWFFRVLTFILVSLAWVLFRSEDLVSSLSMYNSLFGLNGVTLPTHYELYFGDFVFYLKLLGINFNTTPNFGGGFQILWIIAMFLLVWFCPNTIEIMSKFKIHIENENFNKYSNFNFIKWRPNSFFSLILSLVIFFVIIKIFQGREGEFIYFQF